MKASMIIPVSTTSWVYSVYIHIPFCRQRCQYCDFNTYAGIEDLIQPYVNALCQEMKQIYQSVEKQLSVSTIYFGGGTPSLLESKDIINLLRNLNTIFSCAENAEITLESNPGTVNLGWLKEIHSAGVNRLSMGVQSANKDELRILGRIHTYQQVQQAVEEARMAGFENINLDLIYGIPHQTLDTWKESVQAVVKLYPEHLSLYALTLESGTMLFDNVKNGIFPQPEPDLAADMYEWASEYLEQNGFLQYEISNWARSDKNGKFLSCQHNLQYWRNLPYIGLGAGAHGYIHPVRTVNVLSAAEYIHRFDNGVNVSFPSTPATSETNLIDFQAEIGETMMMGLRLIREGISMERFEKRFQTSLDAMFGKQIEKSIRNGLLEWKDGDTLRLTKRGRLLGNQVFMLFI